MIRNTAAHILIAEDNLVSLEMMVSVLEAQRYTVSGATDGSAALDIMTRKSIDLMLVDLNMEPMGGFELIRRLRTRDITAPIVVITGDEATDILLEANALGVMQVLTKPIMPERLIGTVERVLSRQKRKA